MSNNYDCPKAIVIIGGSEPDEPDNYQRLKSLLEQLVTLQEELVCGFPNKPEPILAAKYNQLRDKINRLLGDPQFVENVPKARDNLLAVAICYLLIGFVLSAIIAQWADQTAVSVLRWFLQGAQILLNLAVLGGLLVFAYGYYADPGKFKAVFYSRNSELRDMVQTLHRHAWNAWRSLPSSSGMTELEKAQSEEILRLRMERATMQGMREETLKEQHPMFSNTAGRGIHHPDRRNHLQRLRDQYTANLQVKEEQRAKHGLDVPTGIENEIADLQRRIAKIDDELDQL